MKLTKKQIQYIDNHLIKKGIKYMDVRMELIDHLSSDFEDDANYVLLEDYLNTKASFISEFQKNRHSKLHWFYQKQLWLQFFKHFYTLKGIAITAFVFLLLQIGLQIFEIKTVAFVALAISGIMNLGAMLTHFKKRKAVNSSQLSLFIFAVMSLPALPLYFYGQINGFIEGNSWVFIGFWMLVLLLNISGATVVYRMQQYIIDNYNKLIAA
ncbi:MAG: hypothetical protein AB8B52_13875 [Winogradskyella sp.]|uniref:hypothetical protein n=1 Tax=Winogradskyella sp. TaxID=1883156 RepID=UPI00385EE2B7